MRHGNDRPGNQFPSSSVTYSMLVSESVYKLVVVIERTLRWATRTVFRPALLLFWFVRW